MHHSIQDVYNESLKAQLKREHKKQLPLLVRTNQSIKSNKDIKSIPIYIFTHGN